MRLRLRLRLRLRVRVRLRLRVRVRLRLRRRLAGRPSHLGEALAVHGVDDVHDTVGVLRVCSGRS